MITIRIRFIDDMKVERYPFNELKNVGDEMLFENGYTDCIRQALYSYGRNHGFTYFTKCLGKSEYGQHMHRTYVRVIGRKEPKLPAKRAPRLPDGTLVKMPAPIEDSEVGL